MHPQAEALANGFIAHFWAADHEIEWVLVEPEVIAELAPGIQLIGRPDAIGRDANGEYFFGEWKSANPREAKTWKQVWRMNPQTLTYGVLADALMPGCKRFTVRKAFKSNPPTFDHAWYSYSNAELAFWRTQLIRAAIERETYKRTATNLGGLKPWPTNFGHCFKYGPKYACEFFELACSKLDWDAKPDGALIRIPHLAAERRLNETNGTIVLDATRIESWFGCREQFRRRYVDNIAMPPSEAMQIGLDFHALVADHLRTLVRNDKGGKNG